MSYKSFLFDSDNNDETRERLLRERDILSASPVANSSKIKAIDELLASLEDEDYETERGCATYLFYDKTNDTPNEEDSTENPKPTFKEKIPNSLGAFGVVLYFLARLIVSILPFVMIGGNFFLTLLLVAINTFVPFASIVFWVWGLVCAMQGVQDIWAIIYYIVFIVVWIPFYVSTIISMFSKKK